MSNFQGTFYGYTDIWAKSFGEDLHLYDFVHQKDLNITLGGEKNVFADSKAMHGLSIFGSKHSSSK